MALNLTGLTSTLGDRIFARMRTLGLGPSGRPDGQIPELPSDLSPMTSQQVGTLLSQFSAWLSYITPLVAKASIDAKEAKVTLQVTKRLHNPTPERQSALELDLLEKEAAYDALEALEKSVLRRKEAVSREISRLIGGNNVAPPGDGPRS